MSGGIQNRDYRELTAGIACGAILVAGLAVTSHRHRAAKVIGASLVATSLGPSTRAPEPSLALAPLPTARFHPAKLAQAPNSVSSAPPATAVSSPAISPKSRVQALKIYAALPMMFEANDGQTDSRVRFLARAPDYSLFLTNTEAVLSLPLGSPVASLRKHRTFPRARLFHISKSRDARSLSALCGLNLRERARLRPSRAGTNCPA